MTAIGIALGGGALLLAAVMHLAAPVIVIGPSVAIEAPSGSGPQHAPSVPVRPTVARVISKRTSPHLMKRIAEARSARSAPRIAGSTVPARTQALVAVRNPRAAVGGRARLAISAPPAPPARNATARDGATKKSRKTIVRAPRSVVAKLASRPSASVASTPEPPVGFDERPTLVEAPFAGQSTASTAMASDSRFSGLRIRGRLLATPQPQATAKAAP
jgi:hypothetical protein